MLARSSDRLPALLGRLATCGGLVIPIFFPSSRLPRAGWQPARRIPSCPTRWGMPMWIGVVLAGAALLYPQDLPLEPVHNSGQGITGAFEGWFPNGDGIFT